MQCLMAANPFPDLHVLAQTVRDHRRPPSQAWSRLRLLTFVFLATALANCPTLSDLALNA